MLYHKGRIITMIYKKFNISNDNAINTNDTNNRKLITMMMLMLLAMTHIYSCTYIHTYIYTYIRTHIHVQAEARHSGAASRSDMYVCIYIYICVYTKGGTSCLTLLVCARSPC